jgi:hypothetical protein
MPRIGQLLSALLVALIGVLVVQMFLLAGMQQRLTTDPPAPPPAPAVESLSAPAAAPPPAPAPPSVPAPLPSRASRSIVINTRAAPAPPPLPAPAPMIDLDTIKHRLVARTSPDSDDGQARLDAFIEMIRTQVPASQLGKEP